MGSGPRARPVSSGDGQPPRRLACPGLVGLAFLGAVAMVKVLFSRMRELGGLFLRSISAQCHFLSRLIHKFDRQGFKIRNVHKFCWSISMLKRFVGISALFCIPALAMPAMADWTSNLTDTVKLDVQGAAVVTQRVGTTYSVEGVNVQTSATGSLGLGTTGTAASAAASTSQPATLVPTAFNIVNAGQQFSLSESLTIGDATAPAQTITNGAIGTPTSYGKQTIQAAGYANGLAGGISQTTGAMTITAGGPGTSAVGQKSVSLTVFNN